LNTNYDNAIVTSFDFVHNKFKCSLTLPWDRKIWDAHDKNYILQHYVRVLPLKNPDFTVVFA
jgi:hypothetical protein